MQTKNPYAAREVLEAFDPESTAAVYLVGAKDMAEDPRFANLDGVKKDGTPAHLKTMRDNEELLGFNKHSYVGVAPHVSLDVPGLGEMSATSLREFLKTADRADFEKVMGFFDEEIFEMLQGALQEMSANGGGNVQGGYSKSPFKGFDAKAFNKKQKEDARLRGPKDFLGEEEMVNEVTDYLLGIMVG